MNKVRYFTLVTFTMIFYKVYPIFYKFVHILFSHLFNFYFQGFENLKKY